MFQHYVLYRKAGKQEEHSDEEKKEENPDKVEPNQPQSKLNRMHILSFFACCKSFSVNRAKGDDERANLLPQ